MIRPFTLMKDGGDESFVFGYFIAEFKSLFSFVLLKFIDGSREAYHSHAFNAISFVLKGKLQENMLDGRVNIYSTGRFVITRRTDFHKVVSIGKTWVISLRGPWKKEWKEYLPKDSKLVTLTNGRKIVSINS